MNWLAYPVGPDQAQPLFRSKPWIAEMIEEIGELAAVVVEVVAGGTGAPHWLGRPTPPDWQAQAGDENGGSVVACSEAAR